MQPATATPRRAIRKAAPQGPSTQPRPSTGRHQNRTGPGTTRVGPTVRSWAKPLLEAARMWTYAVRVVNRRRRRGGFTPGPQYRRGAVGGYSLGVDVGTTFTAAA